MTLVTQSIADGLKERHKEKTQVDAATSEGEIVAEDVQQQNITPEKTAVDVAEPITEAIESEITDGEKEVS